MHLLNFNLDYEKARQVLPVLCGALLAVTFGMMLGWPSLAYPYLLEVDITPIPITLDQTSLIAGFLMEGNTIGCLFSSQRLIGSKLAVFLCCCLQVFGWIVMFGASDIYGLLIARSTVGFANGCGMGHLKRYIKETCEPDLAKFIINYLPLGLNIGVILIYTFGAFVSYRVMALIAVIVPIFAAISFGVIPKKELPMKEKQTQITKNILQNTTKLELAKIEENIEMRSEVEQASVFDVLRHRESRNCLFVMFLLIFLQQYTGGPANIVYSQIIFTATDNPLPKICSIIYSIAFFINNIISLTLARTVPRKMNMLISTAGTACIYVVLAMYFYMKEELLQISDAFVWSPLFMLILFNTIHTFGLSTLPLLIIDEKMPKMSTGIASKFWVIHFSMSAVISTKIFQVLFGMFDMFIAYVFFIAVAVGGFILIALFVSDYDPEEVRKRQAEEEQQNKVTEPKIEFIESLKL